jgi:uncharacterized protein YjiS (DUF1127 family)
MASLHQDRTIPRKGGKAMTLQAIMKKLHELRSRQRTRATRKWVRHHLARLPAHLVDDLGVQTEQ